MFGLPRLFDRELFRYLMLPGTDIFTRRRTLIERNWRTGDRKVLDAGFGNGWFAYRAYLSGAAVTAVAIQPELIVKARSLYNRYLGIPEDRLRFMEMNLYDLARLNDQFDEIICYETLEHIQDDQRVCLLFNHLLKPGGVLHLCCPNADHPRWQHEQLDPLERGGHVRHGYNEAGYRKLLEASGYNIDRYQGIGGPLLVYLQERVQAPLRSWLGEPAAAAVSFLSIPLIAVDPASPKVPFSLYVKAVKA